ncbi:MAG: histidine phosphatase family protein [Ilumatobacter sp.]|nr:histidine phosphatase family protein [Ilumatobacter sp.]
MVAAPILLVRHGQSEWNAARRWQGRADSPLTALGRAQAAGAAEALAATERVLGPVWASTSERARATAEIVADRLGLGARTVTADERLCEAEAGEWQGLTPDEIEAAYPGFLVAHRRPPSFEPFDRVVARATAALGDVADATSPGGAAVVVTHSGVIRSLIRSGGVADERIPNLAGVWFGVARSATGVDLHLGDRFDPVGLVVSGVDAPGEDPGEQTDHAGAQRRADR